MWGPSPTKSHGGACYYVIFMDDLGLLHAGESEVFAKFKEWKAEVENQTGRKIKYLRRDNGGKYRDEKFMKFASKKALLGTSL